MNIPRSVGTHCATLNLCGLHKTFLRNESMSFCSTYSTYKMFLKEQNDCFNIYKCIQHALDFA